MLNKPIRIFKLSSIPSLIGVWPRFFVHAEGVGKKSGLNGAEDWLRVWSVLRIDTQAHMNGNAGERDALFASKKAAVNVGMMISGQSKVEWVQLEAQPGSAFGQWLASWAILGRPNQEKPDIKGAWIGVTLCQPVADILNAFEPSN